MNLKLRCYNLFWLTQDPPLLLKTGGNNVVGATMFLVVNNTEQYFCLNQPAIKCNNADNLRLKFFLIEKVLSYVWINATCYPEYGLKFGIDIDSLPGLLIAQPRRRHFAKHSGKFDKDSLVEFIEKSSTGKLNFSPYSRFDDIDQRSCSDQSAGNESKGNSGPSR